MVFILNSPCELGCPPTPIFTWNKICLCSNEEMLAHCKQVFVCHANIVYFVNCDFFSLYVKRVIVFVLFYAYIYATKMPYNIDTCILRYIVEGLLKA